MAKTRDGGCLCGELRYRVTGDPIAVTVCHCPDCQGQSGSAFSMSMLVPREAFQWLAGEPRTWSTRAASGASKDCVFCPECGTRILNRLGSMPATVNLKPGTLDDRSGLEPALQVWTATKQSWVSILDGKPAFARNPGPG
jgi:hypothetical protein